MSCLNISVMNLDEDKIFKHVPVWISSLRWKGPGATQEALLEVYGRTNQARKLWQRPGDVRLRTVQFGWYKQGHVGLEKVE